MKTGQKVFPLQQQEIDSLKKACLYSIPPNKLGFCGPEGACQKLEKFISNPSPENALDAKNSLKKFNALYPYLELIAEANGRQPFSAEVIEAYWLGNGLLENVSFREMQKTILSLQKHGLPRRIAERKAAGLPDGMLPHHSMHVLYINFINPKVKPLIQNLGNCLIQWGEVQEKTAKGISIKGIELISESSELKLKEKEKTVQNPFNLLIQEKDQVSVHWGNAIERISSDELKNLKKYAIKNLETVNIHVFGEKHG